MPGLRPTPRRRLDRGALEHRFLAGLSGLRDGDGALPRAARRASGLQLLPGRFCCDRHRPYAEELWPPGRQRHLSRPDPEGVPVRPAGGRDHRRHWPSGRLFHRQARHGLQVGAAYPAAGATLHRRHGAHLRLARSARQRRRAERLPALDRRDRHAHSGAAVQPGRHPYRADLQLPALHGAGLWLAYEALDSRLLEAASDLGAGRLSSFRRVTLPMTMPGLIAGGMMVFVMVVGDYLTPQLIGGASGVTIISAINDLFGTAFDWPLGSAIAWTMLAFLCLFFALAGLAISRTTWSRSLMGGE
ncbi:MAG: ABC transporter permease subunit [Rhizobiales bacterium]|nr:ABC transporter permease subunit [Hyphomicrobiales bacterium]